MWSVKIPSSSSDRKYLCIVWPHTERCECECWKFRRQGGCHHADAALEIYYHELAQITRDQPDFKLPAGHTFNLRIAPEVWDTAEHQDIAARVLGWRDAAHRREVEAAAREKAAARLETVSDRLEQLKHGALDAVA